MMINSWLSSAKSFFFGGTTKKSNEQPCKYYSTKAVGEACRYISMMENSFYDSLKTEAKLADAKFSNISELSSKAQLDEVDDLLNKIKKECNSSLRIRRTRLDFSKQFTALERLKLGERSQSWIVSDNFTDKKLVMKVIQSLATEKEKCWNAIRDGYRNILGLKHSNVCELTAIFSPKENPSILCFLSPHAPRGSLGNLLIEVHGPESVESPNDIRYRNPEDSRSMNIRQIEKITHFVVTEICWGLVFLHNKRISHSNLKPENVLFDEQGHVQLCDYYVSGIVNHHYMQKFYDLFKRHSPRLANSLINKKVDIANFSEEDVISVDLTMSDGCTETIFLPVPEECDNQCSSVCYAPPESWHMSSTDINFTKDYWSLGVLMYMCYCGGNPFLRQCRHVKRSSKIIQIIAQIMKFRENKFLHSEFIRKFANYDAVDLIKSLITEECNRLGSPSSSKPITKHSYFRGVEFDSLPFRYSPVTTWYPIKGCLSKDDQICWDNNAKGKILIENHEENVVDLVSNVISCSEEINEILQHSI